MLYKQRELLPIGDMFTYLRDGVYFLFFDQPQTPKRKPGNPKPKRGKPKPKPVKSTIIN